MKPVLATLTAAAAVAALALPAAAQTTDHSSHQMPAGGSPATEAYQAASMAMHQAMAIDYSGNADVDFIRGMIPHHEGAVEMAKIVLAHGTDPEVRRLAEGIIAAQEAEIAWMKDWLAKNGG
jgi:uncharacterized protein (DUF305 family)